MLWSTYVVICQRKYLFKEYQNILQKCAKFKKQILTPKYIYYKMENKSQCIIYSLLTMNHLKTIQKYKDMTSCNGFSYFDQNSFKVEPGVSLI